MNVLSSDGNYFTTKVVPSTLGNSDNLNVKQTDDNICELTNTSVLFRAVRSYDNTFSQTYPYMWFGSYHTASVYYKKQLNDQELNDFKIPCYILVAVKNRYITDKLLYLMSNKNKDIPYIKPLITPTEDMKPDIVKLLNVYSDTFTSPNHLYRNTTVNGDVKALLALREVGDYKGWYQETLTRPSLSETYDCEIVCDVRSLHVIAFEVKDYSELMKIKYAIDTIAYNDVMAIESFINRFKFFDQGLGSASVNDLESMSGGSIMVDTRSDRVLSYKPSTLQKTFNEELIEVTRYNARVLNEITKFLTSDTLKALSRTSNTPDRLITANLRY